MPFTIHGGTRCQEVQTSGTRIPHAFHYSWWHLVSGSAVQRYQNSTCLSLFMVVLGVRKYSPAVPEFHMPFTIHGGTRCQEVQSSGTRIQHAFHYSWWYKVSGSTVQRYQNSTCFSLFMVVLGVRKYSPAVPEFHMPFTIRGGTRCQEVQSSGTRIPHAFHYSWWY